MTAEAVRARRTINRMLDAFLARGRSDGTIRADVDATDVIVFTTLITQSLPYGPDWRLMAERQIAIFLGALAGEGLGDLPGAAITRDDVEDAFAAQAARTAGDPGPS